MAWPPLIAVDSWSVIVTWSVLWEPGNSRSQNRRHLVDLNSQEGGSAACVPVYLCGGGASRTRHTTDGGPTCGPCLASVLLQNSELSPVRTPRPRWPKPAVQPKTKLCR